MLAPGRGIFETPRFPAQIHYLSKNPSNFDHVINGMRRILGKASSGRKGPILQIIDVLKGTGTVLAQTSRTVVQYNLEVYETEICGWIRPHLGKVNERMILQMQDGTSVRFIFTDAAGTVMAIGVVPPEKMSFTRRWV
jgi:hypothetical protein